MTRLAILLRTSFLILTLICASQTMARSQKYKVTIKVKEQKLLDVFKSIQQQTNLIVFYSNTILNDQEKVSIQVKDEPLEKVLDKIIAGKALKYEVQAKYIVIAPKEEKKGVKEIKEGMSVEDVAPLPPPTIDVSGRVTDEDGNPLMGASVMIKGTKTGTETNGDGIFKLTNISDNVIVVIGFVGYVKSEIQIISSQKFYSVKLQRTTSKLDEVQVIAYGATSQRFNPGNVGTVKAEDIEKQPVQNPLLALQGRIPGLVITQTNGIAGGAVKVRIQGQNSINNSNLPLYVVDGVPIESTLPRLGSGEQILGEGGGKEGYGNPLNYINPSDIESIDILKDAESTAIYGSRAANGAILITTKKGKAGKTHLDMNFQHGFGKITRFVDMMNRRQYLDMRNEAFKNDGLVPSANPLATTPNKYAHDLMVWDTTRETNWQKTLLGSVAQYTNANLSITGGSEFVQYRLAGAYNKQTTVFPGNFADQRASMHASITNISPDKRFKLQFSTMYMFDDNRLPGTDLTNMAILLAPVAPSLNNPDGSLNWAVGPAGTSTWFTHPLVNILYRKYKNTTTNLVSNLQIGYKIIKNVEIKTNIGYNHLQTSDFIGIPLEYFFPLDRPNRQRSAEYGNRSTRSWNLEPQLSYNLKIGKAKIDALAGFSIQQSKSIANILTGTNHATDEILENIGAATTITSGGGTNSEYKYNGGFVRTNLNWNNKYILNFNARRDGTSRFGPKNRFNNFYSIGGVWIFSQEQFFRNIEWLSFGKLRGSYGITGNDGVGDYSYLSLYGFGSSLSVPYQGASSLSPGAPNNPYLQWEETRKSQLGVDLGLFAEKVVFGVSYGNNRSSNQLLTNRLPGTTGTNSILVNLPALVQNINWEFSMNTKNIHTKNFEWSSNFNLTIARNKLLEFPDLDKSTFAFSLVIGEPIAVSRIYRYAGVNKETGLYQFYDKVGKITDNPKFIDDQVFFSNFPKFYGGFQNTVKYKRLELDLMFQFVKQDGIGVFINNGGGLLPGALANSGSNQPSVVFNRWQKPGDNSLVQKYSTNSSGDLLARLNLVRSSDAVYTDASFIRLKNVAVSWNIPAKWISSVGFREIRLLLQAQNLITITRYKGSDPENQGASSLPPLKVLTFGIKASL